MKPSSQPEVPPAMMAALRRRAAGRPAISFAEFMEVALYEPVLGYYRRERPRIGYSDDTDFLTATSSSPVFGKLVAAACVKLLGPADPSGFEFVELGSERGTSILDGIAHSFRGSRTLGIGEPLKIEGPAVVFSNELFDAQPFRRFRFRLGEWRELGVSVLGEDLSEVEWEGKDPLPGGFPIAAPEGYQIDAPLAAADLAGAIAAQPWNGLFLAFDYGMTWDEMARATPIGTGRAYRRHAQGADLLASPGDQDLTCHVCWDWLQEALSGAGFNAPRVESQEAFFARHAGDFIRDFTAAEAGRLSREKLSLVQLIHPAHMGHKFQALWALRPEAGRPP